MAERARKLRKTAIFPWQWESHGQARAHTLHFSGSTERERRAFAPAPLTAPAGNFLPAARLPSCSAWKA